MICVKIETASLHNQRENLRYFNKHRPSGTLKSAIEYMSNCIVEMKQSKSVNQLLTIEARAKQKYLQTFDEMISDDRFKFDKRTRRPPLNEVNAMISFGNTFIYRRIANEIYRTALDIRIGFVHAANSRSESLNLDIAEIFKPIIVDRHKNLFGVKVEPLKDIKLSPGMELQLSISQMIDDALSEDQMVDSIFSIITTKYPELIEK